MALQGSHRLEKYLNLEPFLEKSLKIKLLLKHTHSVSARPEFLGVIDDPLFENLGIIGKFRGSSLFYV